MPETFDEVIANIFTIKNDTIPQTAWPRLTCGAANEVTFEESSLKLGDQREVFFQNNGQLRAAGELRVLTGAPAATEKLRVLANGNVGIGTTQPGAKLEINNGDLLLKAAAENAGDIIFQNSAGVQKGRIWSRETAGSALFLSSGDVTSDLTIDASGNIGIGTTAPTGKLDVRGEIRAGNSDIYFTRTDHNHTGIGNTAGFAAIENAANYDALMILGRAGTAQGRTVRLWDYLEVNGALNVTGNVGIGTTSPRTQMHVLGRISTGLDFSSAGAITFFPPDGFAWFHIDNGPAGGRPTGRLRISHGNSPGTLEIVSITQAANVGIGVINPQARLHVSGPLIAAGSVFPSDARLKTNIEPMSGVLERLAQVRAISFDWNEKYEVFGPQTDERQIGIIAQELEAVFPQMITTVGDDDYKAVDYSKLAVLLLEAVRELNDKVGSIERHLGLGRSDHG